MENIRSNCIFHFCYFYGWNYNNHRLFRSTIFLEPVTNYLKLWQWESISAFSNADGGTIFLGINEKGEETITIKSIDLLSITLSIE